MINLEQARDLLKRAVATKGRDYVYNPGNRYACKYYPLSSQPEDTLPDTGYTLEELKTQPRWDTGCLIGVALSLAGETLHLSRQCDGLDPVQLRGKYPDIMTSDAALYFTRAQRPQDNGHTWGEAHDAAEDWYASRPVSTSDREEV